MEKSLLILSVLMLTLISFLPVPSFILGAHANINIACGTTYAFNDSNGNYWIGDDQFIQSGSIGAVQNTTIPYSQLLSTVRYFSDSDGNTNCYTIPILAQTNEIDVAAFFLYGNYDDRAQPPSFKLQIDDSDWADVKTSMDDLVAYGRTYLPQADNVTVCLARTETGGVPFISAIQLSDPSTGAPPPNPSTGAPPPNPSTGAPPPNPSTGAPPPNPSTGAPPHNPSTDISSRMGLFDLILAPARESPNAGENPSPNASPKGKLDGFIYLVTLLPGGTLITLAVSVIT